MRTVARGVAKFFVANFAVVMAIMLLPVFLVTDDVALFDSMMEYLFSSKS
ncbi:hypothetical protein [Virgibacillus halodenitrificans]|nr:hypothetical protein [Virgibacillus halodenitrificans]